MTKVTTLKHEGLGNSSYLVELQDRKALVIDPDRCADRYIDAARASRLQIVAILETHLHADFVAGARELADATGAEIYLPNRGGYHFPYLGLDGGDVMPIGSDSVEVLASPGHSPEHVSFVIRSDPPVLFTGGSLLPGGAARTDLAGPELTAELTRSQFRTLTTAFADLPDETRVYPTHGGGSFCAAGAAHSEASTLGAERRTNRWLAMTEVQFLESFPESFPHAPRYFFELRDFNRRGPQLLRNLSAAQPLAHEPFKRLMDDSTVIDIRPVEQYSHSHIPGVLSNPLRPQFATWLGSLVPFGSPILFVGDPDEVHQAVGEGRLIGYEQAVGYLEGGMEAWIAAGLPHSSVQLVHPEAVADGALGEALVIDVRQPEEYASGHIPAAINLPLTLLKESTRTLPGGRDVLVYCAHGERSSSGASILKRAGFRRVTNLSGGFSAWQTAELPVEV